MAIDPKHEVHHGDSLSTPRGLARFIKWNNALETPIEAAMVWAHATLTDAGLPTEAGHYALDGDGGLVALTRYPTNEELALYPHGGGSLSVALSKLGHAAGSPVHTAAELIETLAIVAHYLDAGDPVNAAGFAFSAGMLWEEIQRTRDAIIGRQVRLAGHPAAKGAADHDLHGRWWMADCAIRADDPQATERERADRIAERHGGKPETIRKRLREMKKEKPRR